MPRPWFRMYREERGSFAQLPLVTRGIFDETLKLTDDKGVIQLGARSPADAIAYALGADRADRRALKKAIPELLADGCLVHVGNTLVAPGFGRFQADPNAPRPNHDGATTEPRTDHEPTTTEQRPNHDGATKIDLSTRKDTLAQNVLSSEERVEEIRERVDAGAPAYETSVSAFDRASCGPPPVSPGLLSRADVAKVFSAIRVEHSRGSWRSQGQRDDDRLDALAAWANADGVDRAARLLALDGAVRGFMADDSARVRDARYGIAYLTDPGAYLVAHRAKQPGAPRHIQAGLSPERQALARAQEAYSRDPHNPEALSALRAARTRLLAAEAPT